MAPSVHVLHIYQGQTFDQEIEFVSRTGAPIDLIGKTARMQARESVESSLTTLDLSTEDQTIVLAPDGILRFNLSAAATAALGSHDVAQWVYDLELVTPGPVPVVVRALTGVIVVWPEITRT